VYNRTVVSNTTVGFHALFSTPRAIITPQPALPHSVGTRPELVTRPTVLVPCFRTPPVAAIPRLVLERCSPTQPASRTRPLVGKHFSQTRPDSTTRPMVFPRSPETTTGNHNTANGDEALGSNTTGNFNTTDGAHSLENNTIGSVFGQSSFEGTAVFINSTGKLGTITSSWRFKKRLSRWQRPAKDSLRSNQ